MSYDTLNSHNIYAIPVGAWFNRRTDACCLVYSPLANLFFLATPEEVTKLDNDLREGRTNPTLDRLLDQHAFKDIGGEVSTESFCTLHLLLNEKCNFRCRYCYSAEGRSSAELDMPTIRTTLDWFLSSERKAVRDRTVMFMGGGEPTLSWDLLVQSALHAEKVAREEDVTLHLALTTNGSIMDDNMLDFLRKHDFTVQVSFEILPDVQNEQRAHFDEVAANLVKITEAGINNYVRSTITESNVDRIPEMVEFCHEHFPKVRKMSCQQVVDPEYFSSVGKVDDFFDRYFLSFREAEKKAASYGITLRSSSSHLLNYSKRERFCYNLLCLTPYGTFTTCPDVSSPVEADYRDALVGKVVGNGISFNREAFDRVAGGSIHSFAKCRNCYARWNCGSGCPSTRRVYSDDIFDAICNYYRRMLTQSLMDALAERYSKACGRNFYSDISAKL